MINTTLRIDELIYEKIVKISIKEKRSINAQINMILQEYINVYSYNSKK